MNRTHGMMFCALLGSLAGPVPPRAWADLTIRQTQLDKENTRSFQAGGESLTAALVGGRPAAAHASANGWRFQFVINTQPDGRGEWIVSQAGAYRQYNMKLIGLLDAGGKPAILYTESATGTIYWLRALDADGRSWANPVPAVANAGMHPFGECSVATVNGLPALTYCANEGYDLRYARAYNAQGTTWSPPVTVDRGLENGLYSSLTVVDGAPAVAYYETTSGALRYVRSLDAYGDRWGAMRYLDGGGDSGLNPCLRVIGGKPAVSYYDAFGRMLRYRRGKDARGVDWEEPMVLAREGAGTRSTLLDTIGGPLVAYQMPARVHASGDGLDLPSDHLRVMRGLDAGGAQWTAPAVAAAAGAATGWQPAALMCDGHPAIFFQDKAGGRVMFMRSTDPEGSAWGPQQVADAGIFENTVMDGSLARVGGRLAVGGGQGTTLSYATTEDTSPQQWSKASVADTTAAAYATLMDMGGMPAMSYFAASDTSLRFVRARTTDGSRWHPPILVDNTAGEDTGRFATMIRADGNPAIAYWNQTRQKVMYARALDPEGTAWGPPMELASGGGVLQNPTNISLLEVSGHPMVFYRDAVTTRVSCRRALDPRGDEWGPPTLVVSEPSIIYEPTFRIINGRPAAVYFRLGYRYVRAMDALGTAWESPMILHYDYSLQPLPIGFAPIQGHPVAMYHTASGLTLHRALDPDGRRWGPSLALGLSDLVSPDSLMEYRQGLAFMGVPELRFTEIVHREPEISVEYPEFTELATGGGVDFAGAAPAQGVTRTLLVRNAGTTNLVLGTPRLEGVDAALFSLAPSVAGRVLAPAEILPLSVTFTPPDLGPRAATLVLPSNDADEGAALNLRLTGAGALPPTLTLASPALSNQTAVLVAEIQDSPGAPVTARGFVYAEGAGVPPPELGGAGVTALSSATNALPSFTVAVTNLVAGRTYLFRAYARNAAGLGYSSTETLSLPPPPPPPALAGLVRREGNAVAFTFQGQPGRVYRIERAADLASPDWQPVGESTADGDGRLEWTDLAPLPGPQAYYRVSGITGE